ncbi:MAG: peptide chain release factor 1 [Dehalococcoidia bacterium]
MWDRLTAMEQRFEEVTAEMGRPEVAADHEHLQRLARERASLEQVVSLLRRYRDADKALQEARAIAGEGGDADMVEMAKDEAGELTARIEDLEAQLKRALLPKDPRDDKDVIMEVRGGTGGDEAALFSADLYRMYSRYADRRGWQTEVLSSSETGIGGLKEIVFAIRGQGAYSRLKYESGVHRVQRVPATEAQGRIHTSTATVAVLPEAEEVDVAIAENELRIDIFHASSHGGQNVQKVASAVRITHLPTGLVATCQDERSQFKNKSKAMSVLRARLLDLKEREQAAEMAGERRSQVGTGERSEKIRTYNVSQDRVTDHRIGLTVHNLERILDGEIDELIDAIATSEEARLLDEQAAV